MGFKPDVGVLIVHGIGTQKPGSELRQWADAVLRYLDACQPKAPGSPTPRILQPSPDDAFVRVHTPPLGGTTDDDRQQWLIGEAWWADAFDVPDRKEVSQWMVGVSSWFLYLFVARLWRRFHVDALHMTSGLALALSVGWLSWNVAGARTGQWSGRAAIAAGLVAAAVAAALALRPKRKKEKKQLGSVVVAATLLIGYPLAGMVTAGAFVLWLIGLLPGKISEKARSTQLALAQSVGDVYALIASRRREQAMFDAISAAARRLADAPGMDGKPLVLLAHSQGAALTYRALNTDEGLRTVLAHRPVTLVTYGAAIVPVHVLEQRLRSARQAVGTAVNVLGWLGLLLAAFGVVRLAADGFDRVAARTTGLSAALVTLAFVSTWRHERRARPSQDTVAVVDGTGASLRHEDDKPDTVRIGLRAPEGTELRWVDLWAPWDPVPNGPLSVTAHVDVAPFADDDLPRPSGTNQFWSCRVANLHQPWRDHVVYRDNHEDVVSRWVGEIAARADCALAPVDVERPGCPGERAARSRTWRMLRGKSLLIGQVGALVAGFVAIACYWTHLDDLGRRVVRRIPLRSALSSAADLVPEGARDVVFGQSRDASHLHGLVVALALVLMAVVIATKVVAAGQKAATGAYLAGKADDVVRARGWKCGSVATVAALVAVAVVALVLGVDDVATRRVEVLQAKIGDPSTPTTSQATTVRFEPVATGDDTPLIVKVGKHAATIDLDSGVAYRITAMATGGKDCKVSAEPAERPTRVTVSCAAAGTLLPPVAG